MIKSYKLKGKWSIPNSNIFMDGILDFDPDNGAVLEIFGSFKSHVFDQTSKGIIIGNTTDGEVTLVDNWYRSSRTNKNGVVISI